MKHSVYIDEFVFAPVLEKIFVTIGLEAVFIGDLPLGPLATYQAKSEDRTAQHSAPGVLYVDVNSALQGGARPHRQGVILDLD